MISQADKTVLSTVFGEEMVEKISGAFATTEEVSLGLRLDGKIYKPDEISLVKNEAVKQGKELGYKEIAKNLDLQLEAGEKDPAIIAGKFKTVLSTQFEEKYKSQTPTEELIAAAKKAGEWEQKYNALFDTHKKVEQTATEWQQKYAEKEQAIANQQYNVEILSYLPDKLPLAKDDALLIMRNIIEKRTDDEGNVIYYIENKPVLDAVGNPEALKNVVALAVDKKEWLKAPGMGGGDRGGAGNSLPKGMTTEQAREYVVKKGIVPTSPEGLKLLSQLTKK